MVKPYFNYDARRFYFLGNRIARRCTADNYRRRIRFDELHHASHVVTVGNVFLLRAVSAISATVHSSAAADCPQQRAPGSDERRRRAFVQLASDLDPVCVVCCVFCCGAEDLQMAVSGAAKNRSQVPANVLSLIRLLSWVVNILRPFSQPRS